MPLAADSLGTRSMATWVELEGVRVLIDPGVTVAETRYGLPPMQEERQALETATSRVIGALCQADAAVVTHFHEEHVNLLHYVLSSTAIYMKTPVTPSEVRATQALFPRLERTGRAFSMADDSSVNLRDVTLTFSRPLPHGKAGAKAGSVMAVAVQARSGCFVHASDVQGPLSAAAVEWVIRQRPDVLYLSGAPTYKLFYQAERDADTLTAPDIRNRPRQSADHHEIHRMPGHLGPLPGTRPELPAAIQRGICHRPGPNRRRVPGCDGTSAGSAAAQPGQPGC